MLGTCTEAADASSSPVTGATAGLAAAATTTVAEIGVEELTAVAVVAGTEEGAIARRPEMPCRLVEVAASKPAASRSCQKPGLSRSPSLSRPCWTTRCSSTRWTL